MPPGRSDRGRRSGDRPAARGAGDACRPTALRRSGRASRSRHVDIGIRRAGADLIELATDADWLATIVQHVRRKRVQAVKPVNAMGRCSARQARHGIGRRRMPGLPQPGAPVVAARRRRPGRRLRARAAVADNRQGSASRRSTCSTASRRPGRDGGATSSPPCSSPGLPPVSWRSPGRSRRRPNAPRARAASSCCSTSRCR